MILDIGCGPVDRADIRLDVAKSKATNILGSAEYLPFRAKVFDSVLSFHCYEHLFNPTHALSELNRVLKDDGKALIEVPKPMFTNHCYYVLVRYLGSLSCFFPNFWIREVKYIYEIIHRAKTDSNHPLVHKSIISRNFLESQMRVVSQKDCLPIFLLPTQHYVSLLLRKPVKIVFLNSAVQYTLQKSRVRESRITFQKGSEV